MSSLAPSGNPSHILLSRAHSPTTATRIFNEKIQHKPLFLRASSPSRLATDARSHRQLARAAKQAEQRRSKKPRPLSARQKRILGVYELPKDQQKYDVFVPLWRLWCGYIREILGVKVEVGAEDGQQTPAAYVTPSGAGPLLASADFHGAELLVVRSRCVGRVGIQGIVARDTKFTFDIITSKNEMKTVPKEHTIFRFTVPLVERERPDPDDLQRASPADQPASLIFEIYGEQFMSRAPDRATKRFRLHIAKDL